LSGACNAGEDSQFARAMEIPMTVQAHSADTLPYLVDRLNDREVMVLRMLADGSNTREIAHRLNYSERTVKAIIQDITQRFGLRNRSHAVAFALRNGLI
jgi:DNA-binding NarL/FixJ family response regulator